MAKKQKYRGHYCWVCGRIRPNERFSGSGHSRHICGNCHKLGSEELAYRQEIHNIERCLDCGRIRRKQRKTFERFLIHTNPRVRDYAQRIKLSMQTERLAWKAMIDEDERQLDEYLGRLNANDQDLGTELDSSDFARVDEEAALDADIPF